MGKVAIRVQGLSKQFRIGKQERYRAFRDIVTEAMLAPFRRAAGLLRGNAAAAANLNETIWALKDVAFEVKNGDVVGIIGRNGAGKSTLLKILSRITEPTEGQVDIYGRVGALLEVGTGFHPELTGRENIYLNGAILGMKREEIRRKFDEIVAFSEVEKFIDTPVKHYSSGMGLRLGFAVAAHLEPDILIVDEVLAVGDATFQKKCLGKMGEVAGEGRTVLFVSHNLDAVTRLCSRGVLLDQGRVIADGPTQQVVRSYLRSGLGTMAAREWQDNIKAPGNDIARLRSVRVTTQTGQTADALDIRQPIGIEMNFEVLAAGHVLVPNLHFFNEDGICVFISSDVASEWNSRPRPVGIHKSTCWIPGNFMAEGSFTVNAALSTMNPVVVHFDEHDAVAFQVVDSLDGNSARGQYAGPIPGVVRPLLDWTDEMTAPAEKVPNTMSNWGS
jgi:lipopolysaccharide transport system ATP-binding protein